MKQKLFGATACSRCRFVILTVLFCFLPILPLEAHYDPQSLEVMRVDIGDTEVKAHVNLDVEWLLEVLGMSHLDPEHLSPEDKHRILDETERMFSRQVTVTINGINVQPVLDRDSTYFNPHLRRYDVLAMLTFRYGAPDEVRQLRVRWDLFGETGTDGPGPSGRSQIPVVLEHRQAEQREERNVLLTPEMQTVRWRAPGVDPAAEVLPHLRVMEPAVVDVPVLTVLCLLLAVVPLFQFPRRHPLRVSGSICFILLSLTLLRVGTVEIPYPGQPSYDTVTKERAEQIFRILLENVYRSHNYERPEDMYDTLDHSLHGETLTELFVQMVQSRNQRGSDNSRTDILRMNLLETNLDLIPDRAGEFSVDARWRVYGTIFHWGHVHSRINQYRAHFRVQQVEGRWKITDVEILDYHRYFPDDEDST